MAVLQDSPAGCGPGSVCNVLDACGIRIPQEMAWKLSGCTGTKGTSERGIIKAITTLGHRAVVLREKDPGIALTTLRGYLLHGVPLVVLVDGGCHWVSVTGTLGPRVCVIDPADGGVISYPEPDAFLARWTCPGEARPFYAIACIVKQP